MKARIFVTLMIILSMCMVSAATQEEEPKGCFNEGDDAGYWDGYVDGLNGNNKDYSKMTYPPDCQDEGKSSYKNGYRSGYKVGYTVGANEAEEDANDDSGDPKPAKTIKADNEDPVNCLSSPALGLGLRLPDGTITQRGDQLPTLYTWAEKDNKYEHHTTFYYPLEGTHTGCVIVTPPQIAGEPLVESNFWNTPKGQRILQWKANAG